MNIKNVMYSFILDKKNKNDASVTGTYMQIIRNACSKVGEVEVVHKGDMPSCKRNVVVSDTLQNSLYYFLKGYRNQIVWMQGVVPEESYMRHNSKIRYYILSLIEKNILAKSKLLFMVSDSMLKHYEKKYKLSLADKSFIMPCFNETSVNDQAFYNRKYDNNSFLYVGGMAKWQCFEKMAELFSKIEKLTTEKICFYVYTFDQENALDILNKYNVTNYKVDYASKEELSDKIKGFKYGFVLRENNTVNYVATPTKFSNYLSNGIIPVYSSSLSSFSEIDGKFNIGIVCDVDDLDAAANRIIKHMNTSFDPDIYREKCKEIFNSYYNADLYTTDIVNKLKEIYTA